MFNKDKDYISVSLSEETLKVLHLRISGGQPKIQNVVKRDVRGVAVEELPPLAHAAVSELGVKNVSAVYAVCANVVTTKNIEVPSLDPAEIKSIIDLQAGRHTPYAREEILVGFITIGVFQRNYTKVLLVIINREVLKKQLSVFENTGLRIEKVVFAPEAMARFYAQMLSVKNEDSPVGIINVMQYRTDFMIEFNSTVATCRSLPVGMTHLIKEGGSARDKLLDELGKSLEAYQNEDINKVPEVFYLTNEDAKLKEIQSSLQERLKANIKFLPCLEKMQGSQPALLKFVSDYGDDSFLDVLAAGISGDNLQVDLTPDEVKLQRTMEEKGRQVLRAIIFSIVIIFLVIFLFYSKGYFKGAMLEKLNDDYLDKQKSVIELDRIGHKTRIIKDFLRDRMVSLDIIQELYKLIPNEIYLENIRLEDDGSITVTGVSDSMSVIFNFITTLEESTLFKGVKTRSTTAKKERDKDVAAFEIGFRLESAKDETEAARKEKSGKDKEAAGDEKKESAPKEEKK